MTPQRALEAEVQAFHSAAEEYLNRAEKTESFKDYNYFKDMYRSWMKLAKDRIARLEKLVEG